MTFEDLEVWQRAREMVRRVYAISAKGEFSKDFGLRNQIRRASVSIGSNIAEGFERDGRREFLQFLSQAKGSAGEVRAQLHFAHDLGYLDPDTYRSLVEALETISRQLAGFMRRLRTSTDRGHKFT